MRGKVKGGPEDSTVDILSQIRVVGITITQPENLVHQWFIPTTFGEKVQPVYGISHVRDIIELSQEDYKISGPV